jgi:hypothetical protein
MQMQAKLFATAMKQWERLGKTDLLSYALSIQFLSGSSLEVHMQLNIASVIAVSQNGDMSQQNSAALKVTDFNFYKK